MFRDDDDANDDPDYQQPASVSQKDDDLEDEDDKVTVRTRHHLLLFHSQGLELWLFLFVSLILMVSSAEEAAILILRQLLHICSMYYSQH